MRLDGLNRDFPVAQGAPKKKRKEKEEVPKRSTARPPSQVERGSCVCTHNRGRVKSSVGALLCFPHKSEQGGPTAPSTTKREVGRTQNKGTSLGLSHLPLDHT